MQYSVESKSQLAKLLASENLRVEHKKVQTASFNLRDRVLTCPIWKDMTGEMYDLLLGHEVGHALETPEEGWHDAVTTGKSQFSKNFKQFLNVIEDARIEKKIKRKFPGIKPSFIKAYGQLLERDFFGIKNEDVNQLPFIDRLNLFTKGGYNLGIQFNDTEASFLREVESCETWEDVVRVTGAIFEYSKKEQQDINKIKQDIEFGDFDDSDEYEYGDNDVNEYEESDEISDDAKNAKTKDESNSDDGEDYVNEINRHKPTANSNDYQESFEPKCETDETFRDNEALLLDAKSKEFIYLNIPKFYPENSITPCKRVHELMENHWAKYYSGVNIDIKVTQDTLLKEFKNRNDRYVSLLAKEFEMRKAASKFSKQMVSETGDIDISRIYKYKVDDNIFRKMMRIPKGKSHGLILVLDRSGSMDGNMQSSIEQILILTMFCRKVNIPFVVYGFGNCATARQLDLGQNEKIKPSFSKENKELLLSDVYMREYMNSRMGNAEFNRCLRNMVSLMNSYMPRYQRKIDRPYSETLSNTPMIEAMIASRHITNEFRKVNNLDIVNMVLIHDGDADTVNGYFTGETTEWGAKNNWFSEKTQSVVIRDTHSKFETLLVSEEQFKDNDPMRTAIFNWYRQVTGAKIIGFFLIGSGTNARAAIQRKYISGNESPRTEEERYDHNKSHLRWMREKDEAKEMLKVIKTTKFLESKNKGYNKFFLIPGGNDLDVEDDELLVDGTVTAAKLRTAFIKMNKKKQVSRVLVNRFIGEIAM